jgi:aminomethyltransferase
VRPHSVLNDRHRALGAKLDRAWNGRPVAERYASDPYDEVAALRYGAGLIDISSHNILTVTGKHAAACLDYVLTSAILPLEAGQTHCSNIVGEHGGLIDDVLVYCDGPEQFRLSHGEGQLHEVLAQHAPAFGVSVARDDDVHVLSLQGPRATAVLEPLASVALSELVMGVHRRATLLDRPVILTRGGFFGETGFEIFCTSRDAVALWDGILEAGHAAGVTPLSWRCLEIARVEAGLLFFPYDMPHGDTTPWEVRAGWTVDASKPDFLGRRALLARRGQERSLISGLEVAAAVAMPPGAEVRVAGDCVGCVTSSVFSRHLMKSLAMAHLAPQHSVPGASVTIAAGEDVSATVVPLPFYDPLRLRTA